METWERPVGSAPQDPRCWIHHLVVENKLPFRCIWRLLRGLKVVVIDNFMKKTKTKTGTGSDMVVNRCPTFYGLDGFIEEKQTSSSLGWGRPVSLPQSQALVLFRLLIANNSHRLCTFVSYHSWPAQGPATDKGKGWTHTACRVPQSCGFEKNVFRVQCKVW